jgi:hypothetical protein
MSTEPFAASTVILLRRWYLWETARLAEHAKYSDEPATVSRRSFDGDKYGPFQKADLVDHPIFKQLIELDYVRSETNPECWGTVIFNAGHKMLPYLEDRIIAAMVTEEGGFGSRAVDELATYILLYGSVDDTYCSFESQGKIELWDERLVHTLLCGIDWKKSSGPHDDEWSSFTDSASPNTEYPVIQLDLTCSCGKVNADTFSGAKVGIKPLGTAELIRRVSDGFFKS